MNMMPGFAPKPGDLTRHDPSMLPWSFRFEHPNAKAVTVLNACNDPIGTLDANSHAHLVEMVKMIEEAFRARDQLSDVNRYYANRTQREMQRGSRQR
jgi:hypothetical protein